MDPGRVVSRFDDLITRFIPIAKYFIPSIYHVRLLALLWDSSFIANPPQTQSLEMAYSLNFAFDT